MSTYLTVKANPADVTVSVGIYGIDAEFIDHASGGYRCSVRFTSSSFEKVKGPVAPDMSYQNVLIPTEPAKAAQGKVKISRADLPQVQFFGEFADLTMDWREAISLTVPSPFTAAIGGPVVVKPFPEKYPGFTLQVFLFNEP